MATIKEIAKECGVSVATVSNILNHKPGASDATRELVLETAKKLDYTPNYVAKNLKIHDEYDDSEEEDLTEIIPDREYVALGSARLDDLDDQIHLNIVSDDYDSIGGYIIEQLDRFPTAGESVTTDSGVRLVVDKTDRNRIEAVHIYLPESFSSPEKDTD